jgi:transposase
MIGAESQRLKRAPERLGKSIARLLKALQKELTSVDGDIDDAVRGSPAWREKEDLLTSVPGIGKTIARTLIAQLPNSAASAASRSPRWRAWRPSPANRELGAARAASAAAGSPCARRCSWAPWSPGGTTPS